MKVNLTLQEKLRDLRDERKLKLQDVADVTSIPLATLRRIGATRTTKPAIISAIYMNGVKHIKYGQPLSGH